jgi:uncharacterized protein with GYD domain
VIGELPDGKAAAALNLTVAASGSISITTADLFTAADLDEIAGGRPTFRPPGG